MATYNGARHVAEQLASLASQTVLPYELVVTDDASTDATPDIVAAFAASAPFPVRLIKNAEQLGYRANFMKAAGLCQADLVAFSDQDDVWLPRKLEAVNATFENSDTLLTYHDATVVTEKLEPFAFLHEAFDEPAAVNPATPNTSPSGSSDELQFDVVEPAPGVSYAAAAPAMSCVACRQPIVTAYYALADMTGKTARVA